VVLPPEPGTNALRLRPKIATWTFEESTLLAREGRARAEFISKVSHELRTPLTVANGVCSSIGSRTTEAR
jgi:signal transduction histidine kinase